MKAVFLCAPNMVVNSHMWLLATRLDYAATFTTGKTEKGNMGAKKFSDRLLCHILLMRVVRIE